MKAHQVFLFISRLTGFTPTPYVFVTMLGSKKQKKTYIFITDLKYHGFDPAVEPIKVKFSV